MFHEYEVVKLKRGLLAENTEGWPGAPSMALQAGTLGTIVVVYENDWTGNAYEVEFVAADGSTLGLLTLTDSDLEPRD
jgi:hypothetical protein